ncbi:hypothetical protein GE09DRAFT_238302 [Coniochaeta sp. 2T2.1]|nr:hypothetical protein GE09DRAFT_238302 [Coniochaeta sp. 2T2.1]
MSSANQNGRGLLPLEGSPFHAHPAHGRDGVTQLQDDIGDSASGKSRSDEYHAEREEGGQVLPEAERRLSSRTNIGHSSWHSHAYASAEASSHDTSDNSRSTIRDRHRQLNTTLEASPGPGPPLIPQSQGLEQLTGSITNTSQTRTRRIVTTSIRGASPHHHQPLAHAGSSHVSYTDLDPLAPRYQSHPLYPGHPQQHNHPLLSGVNQQTLVAARHHPLNTPPHLDLDHYPIDPTLLRGGGGGTTSQSYASEISSTNHQLFDAMRYPAGDLAILSAESYDDGLKHHASASASSSAAAAGKTRKTTAVVDVAAVSQESPHEGPARKRRKTASPDAGGEDAEEKKRSRGRPRLEPKDETAQDRRRTQIRLAQRAYRNRKENAIQTLERRVQELKDTNEEMNNAFLRLHDYAVGCGLLDRMPEVGRQLRETTQKFLSLARKSNEEGYHDDDPRDSDTQPTTTTITTRRGYTRRKSSSVEVIDRTPPSHAQDTTPPSHRQLFGGLVVAQEQVSLSDMDTTPIPNHLAVDSHPTPDYEVITYPTLDNASFPFGFGSDFDFSTPDLTNPNTTTGSTGGGDGAPDFSDITNLNSTLYPSLPVPNSYASQEVTFGRRFQRTALERAWTLVTMPNPPQKRFSRVFGFCLLFEPLESIKARLRRGLDRTSGESLNNWQYPFLHLGGGGTHFDTTTTEQGQRVGNQGTVDVMRSKVSGGAGGSFSMGPFDAKTSAARDMLDVSQYLPPGSAGFGAEFYDCDEIEMYLHQRGVVIPPAADFVTVEIDVGAFADEQGTEQQSGGGNTMFGESSQQSVGGGSLSESSARSTCPTLSPGASSGEDTNMTTAPSDFSQQQQHTDMWRFDAGDFGGMKTGGGGGGVGGMGDQGMAVAMGKKRVTIDVKSLIFEMVERATCLGRSPGLRRQDINGAFWNATKYNS